MIDFRLDDRAILEQRRQLVELSAELQRATITRRLDAIEHPPRGAWFATVADFASRPAVRRVAFAAAVMAFRKWRGR